MRRLIMLLLFCASFCFAGDIVVLTNKTPVAEFTLPDGYVLKNAYAWKRSSQGIMIIHDDGSHFLNFEALPFAWKKAYGLVPPDVVDPDAPKEGELKQYEVGEHIYMSKEDAEAFKQQMEKSKGDQYGAAETLRSIRELPYKSIRYYTSPGYDGTEDEALLTACVCQNLLKENMLEAKRFWEKLNELYPENTVKVEELFPVCEICKGKRVLSRICRTCSGTGACPKCKGTGQVESGLGKEMLDCTACRKTGKCTVCGGAGTLTRQCLDCRGRGRMIQREQCQEKLAAAVAILSERYLKKAAEVQ